MTLFSQIDKDEFKFYSEIMSEGYNLVYPKIPIFILDRFKTQVDPLLKETILKIFKPVQYISGYVIWDPPVLELAKFGIEDAQQVLVQFSLYDLQQNSIVIEDLPGSVMLITTDGKSGHSEYVIRTAYQKPDEAIGWYAFNLNVAVTLDLREPSSYSDETDLEVGGVNPINANLLFPAEDTAFYEELLLEGYNLTMPKIPILALDREKTQQDLLLNESAHKVYKDPLYLPGFVEWQPPVFTLTKFGIETEQEVLVLFSYLALREAGFEDLDLMVGGLLILQLDALGTRRHFEIRSMKKQPQDAFNPYGDILNVAATVSLYESHSDSEDVIPFPDLDTPFSMTGPG